MLLTICLRNKDTEKNREVTGPKMKRRLIITRLLSFCIGDLPESELQAVKQAVASSSSDDERRRLLLHEFEATENYQREADPEKRHELLKEDFDAFKKLVEGYDTPGFGGRRTNHPEKAKEHLLERLKTHRDELCESKTYRQENRMLLAPMLISDLIPYHSSETWGSGAATIDNIEPKFIQDWIKDNAIADGNADLFTQKYQLIIPASIGDAFSDNNHKEKNFMDVFEELIQTMNKVNKHGLECVQAIPNESAFNPSIAYRNWTQAVLFKEATRLRNQMPSADTLANEWLIKRFIELFNSATTSLSETGVYWYFNSTPTIWMLQRFDGRELIREWPFRPDVNYMTNGDQSIARLTYTNSAKQNVTVDFYKNKVDHPTAVVTATDAQPTPLPPPIRQQQPRYGTNAGFLNTQRRFRSVYGEAEYDPNQMPWALDGETWIQTPFKVYPKGSAKFGQIVKETKLVFSFVYDKHDEEMADVIQNALETLEVTFEDEERVPPISMTQTQLRNVHLDISATEYAYTFTIGHVTRLNQNYATKIQTALGDKYFEMIAKLEYFDDREELVFSFVYDKHDEQMADAIQHVLETLEVTFEDEKRVPPISTKQTQLRNVDVDISASRYTYTFTIGHATRLNQNHAAAFQTALEDKSFEMIAKLEYFDDREDYSFECLRHDYPLPVNQELYDQVKRKYDTTAFDNEDYVNDTYAFLQRASASDTDIDQRTVMLRDLDMWASFIDKNTAPKDREERNFLMEFSYRSSQQYMAAYTEQQVSQANLFREQLQRRNKIAAQDYKSALFVAIANDVEKYKRIQVTRQDVENRLHSKCYALVRTRYANVEGAEKFVKLFPNKDAFLKSFLRAVGGQTDEDEDLFLIDCFSANENNQDYDVTRLVNTYNNLLDEERDYMERILQRMATWLGEFSDEEEEEEDSAADSATAGSAAAAEMQESSSEYDSPSDSEGDSEGDSEDDSEDDAEEDAEDEL
jgi:hypothetical protein